MNALAEAVDASLRPRIHGPVYLRGEEGLAAEVAGFNLIYAHQPDVVVGVANEQDVVASVRFAAEHSLPVYVQATGHGQYSLIDHGMLLITRRLDALEIDQDTRIAHIGGGLKWARVVARSAELGLAPVTGSSPDISAVGLVLGGGIGPLARTYGFAADWVRSFRVVTADGSIVTAGPTEHPDLFWALRGGKGGLGVVTSVDVELLQLSSVYGGGLFFAEEDMEAAFRAWVDWTATVPDAVTSSVAVLRLPDVEDAPPPLRNRTVLHLRFVYAGAPGSDPAQSQAEAEELLMPLRTAAPVYLDLIGELPMSRIAEVHHDPDGPLPVWDGGLLLRQIDQDFVTTLLGAVGDGSSAPLLLAEVRHIGGAAHRQPAAGDAIAGRSGEFSLYLVGAPVPELFDQVLPEFARTLTANVQPWVHAEMNVNLGGHTLTAENYARAWPVPTWERLSATRSQYDPAGLFAYAPAAKPVPA